MGFVHRGVIGYDLRAAGDMAGMRGDGQPDAIGEVVSWDFAFLASFFNLFDRRVPLLNGILAGAGARSHMWEVLPLARLLKRREG